MTEITTAIPAERFPAEILPAEAEMIDAIAANIASRCLRYCDEFVKNGLSQPVAEQLALIWARNFWVPDGPDYQEVYAAQAEIQGAVLGRLFREAEERE